MAWRAGGRVKVEFRPRGVAVFRRAVVTARVEFTRGAK
jgi:hypothetical protein